MGVRFNHVPARERITAALNFRNEEQKEKLEEADAGLEAGAELDKDDAKDHQACLQRAIGALGLCTTTSANKIVEERFAPLLVDAYTESMSSESPSSPWARAKLFACLRPGLPHRPTRSRVVR